VADSSALLVKNREADPELPAVHTAGPQEPDAVAAPQAEPLVAQELLVEEVSIDGMCGVY
jgi:mycofactocin precursor